MAASSSSSPQHPTPTTAVAIITTTTTTEAAALPKPSSRRLPPPCWSHEETVALIDSYRDKWYSLRRGNLKASHWQEVADAVSHRCPFTTTPSKTSVQCRHKVEKLRKRYRTEKQKALTNPARFSSSSWVYFRKMDSMEKGPSSTNGTNEDDIDNDDDDDDDENNEVEEEEDYDDDPMPPPTNTRSLHRLLNNGVSRSGGGIGGFRLRIPSRPTTALPSPVTGFRSKGFDEKPNNANPNPRYLNGCSSSRFGFGRRSDGGGGGVGGGGGRGGVKREFNPVSEMVTSIKMLGEGFVKMEQMKIEVAREIERMRMEMEMKRTEMILESQQRIVEAFTKGFSGKKKIKRFTTPDS